MNSNTELKNKMESLGYRSLPGLQLVPSPQQILQLEGSLGAALPQDYKKFVQDFAFSTFNNYVAFNFLEDCPWAEDGKGLIDIFLGFDEEDGRDLQKTLQRLSGRIPSEYLPIADDALGNRICIKIKGEEIGSIHFWAHDEEEDEPENNMYLISKSFAEFIDNLFVDELD